MWIVRASLRSPGQLETTHLDSHMILIDYLVRPVALVGYSPEQLRFCDGWSPASDRQLHL